MHIEFQSYGKPNGHPATDEEDEVFSRVKNPNHLLLRHRPEVQREIFNQRVSKIIFVVSVAAVVALATQATAAKVFGS